jgi:osmotically inducible protein OsmC
MALKRNATAVWHGNGPTGQGTLTTLSGAFQDQPYSAKTRFQAEDGRAGTNPEELIAAAHAGCFTMALSFNLTNAGHTPTELKTVATVARAGNAPINVGAFAECLNVERSLNG